jgi:hypothetical protein
VDILRPWHWIKGSGMARFIILFQRTVFCEKGKGAYFQERSSASNIKELKDAACYRSYGAKDNRDHCIDHLTTLETGLMRRLISGA